MGNILASKDSEVTNSLICDYHRARVMNRNTVSELLHAEHNISMALMRSLAAMREPTNTNTLYSEREKG
jgi:hypothetical protein